MKFSHIDGYYVFMKVKMVRCRTCGEYMVDVYDNAICDSARYDLRNNKILLHSNVTADGVCDDCVRKGEYKLQCNLCNKIKDFPGSFAYQIRTYNGSGDYTRHNICEQCVIDKAQTVITLLAEAGDIKRVD